MTTRINPFTGKPLDPAKYPAPKETSEVNKQWLKDKLYEVYMSGARRGAKSDASNVNDLLELHLGGVDGKSPHPDGSPQSVHGGVGLGVYEIPRIGHTIPVEHIALIKEINIGVIESGSLGSNKGDVVTLDKDAPIRTFAHEVGHSVLRHSENENELRKNVFNLWGKQISKQGGKYSDYEYVTDEIFARVYSQIHTGEGWKYPIPEWLASKIKGVKINLNKNSPIA